MPDSWVRICPSCGGKVEFAAGTERVACEHCGAELTVHQSGALVSLAAAGAPPAKPQARIDKTPDLPAAAQPEAEIQQLTAEVTRLRLERDIQGLKAELAQLQARRSQAAWTWLICTDLLVWAAGRTEEWACLLAAVIAPTVVLVAYVFNLRQDRRDLQADLDRKQHELWQMH